MEEQHHAIPTCYSILLFGNMYGITKLSHAAWRGEALDQHTQLLFQANVTFTTYYSKVPFFIF